MIDYIEIKKTKEGKWGFFKEGTYLRFINEKFDTLAEASDFFHNSEHNEYGVWADACVGDKKGFYLPINMWIADVENGSFINYDGYGYLLKGDNFFGGTIKPSQYKNIPEGVDGILWINR